MTDLTRVAHQVAARYKRQCWWADLDDLRQEAHRACVEAHRTWDAHHGAPLTAYARRAAVLAVRNFLWRAGSPVSASDHYLTELRGKHRAPEELVPEDDDRPWADAILADRQWRTMVRARIESLMEYDVEQGNVPEEAARVALDVVLSGDDGKGAVRRAMDNAAAAPTGAQPTIAQVYRARSRLSSLVLRDLQCYQLWKEPQP